MYRCPGDQKRALDPQKLGLQSVVRSLTWVLGTEPRSSEEQQVFLTTEPSLQPFTCLSNEYLSCFCTLTIREYCWGNYRCSPICWSSCFPFGYVCRTGLARTHNNAVFNFLRSYYILVSAKAVPFNSSGTTWAFKASLLVISFRHVLRHFICLAFVVL